MKIFGVAMIVLYVQGRHSITIFKDIFKRCAMVGTIPRQDFPVAIGQMIIMKRKSTFLVKKKRHANMTIVHPLLTGIRYRIAQKP
mmetsp:Transcript_3535/g.5456  ORF Transcript_3535/g.5456 Transcript_3535/m.5456 type:complete len:85 (+) Transcript_3535:1929-2183(+)